ncbi:MAG: hypothetical protein ACKV2U_15715 [Bryobacteraceae bacterium]
MDRCWANVLGDCSGGLSGEHIITESLFSGNNIGVKGMPWGREGYKFIGKASYTSNILCRKHNSDLSPIDEAGTFAFATFRTMAEISTNRRGMLQSGVWAGRFDLVEQRISGNGLERWLLKTLINMEIAGKQGYRVGPHAPPNKIDPELVEIAFGLRSFRDRAGLYFAAFEAEAINMQERVVYTSWIKGVPPDLSYVGAGAFSFYGFRYFLCLEPAGFPNSIDVQGRKMNLWHHVDTINVELDDKPSQQVHLTW